MARRSSSSRWSHPATGKQIAALKAHGNYDGKYYSLGRASQAIGRSTKGGSSATRSGGGGVGYSPNLSPAYSPKTFLAQLLGVPDDLDSILAAALEQSSTGAAERPDDRTAVESVAFSVAPDESNAAEPRILFEAVVVRDPRFVGEPSFDVRFVSNVDFGEAPASLPQEFRSGVELDD